MPHSVEASGRSRPSACELACVDPKFVARIWPSVCGLIRAAMRRGGLGSYAPVEESVLAGRALLWLVIDATAIEAAIVSELHQTEWRKVCVVVAGGGKDMRRWIGLIGKIEEFARAEGCSAMRIVGRKGWARMLSEYRTTRIVLEKELS
jgi:hypothetical protein